MHNIAIGQKFKLINPNDESTFTDDPINHYILAQASAFKVCLINLKKGNRYLDPVTVEQVDDITEKEWDKISDCDEKEYWVKID